MPCCCQRIFELCDVPVCSGSIKTGIAAAITGRYKLVVDYLDTQFEINSEEITATEEIIFPATDLNEHYKFTGKIYDPNGAEVTFTVEGLLYNCIGFQTVMKYEVNPVS